MLSRKQCGRRFFSRNPETSLSTLPPSSGTRKEIDETWRGRHVRRMPCVNHLFYQLGWFWAFGVEDTNTKDDEFQVYLKWTLHSIDLILYISTLCTVTTVVQWGAHSPEVSMDIRTAKVCVPWFAILAMEGHPNFLQNIFLCCWND